MSVTQIAVGSRTIAGLASDDLSNDLSLRNNKSTIIGYLAANKTRGVYNTVLGYETGRNAVPMAFTTAVGYRAGYISEGARNTFIGHLTGGSNRSGTSNIFVGYRTGEFTRIGANNTVVGNESGTRFDGSRNVMLGDRNTTQDVIIEEGVSIGYGSEMKGGRNVSLGFSNNADSHNCTLVGALNRQTGGNNNILVGSGIENTADDCVIIRPGTGIDSEKYENDTHGHLNIMDTLIRNRTSAGAHIVELKGHDILLGNLDTVAMRISPAGVSIYGGEMTISSDIVMSTASVEHMLTLFSSTRMMAPTGLDGHWTQYVNDDRDMILESSNGTVVEFTENFRPEVLNFTGKHRCAMESLFAPGVLVESLVDLREGEKEGLLGKLVIATGRYSNLDGVAKIDIDEAIPVVRMCDRARDKRVFGVVGGVEDQGGAQGGSKFYLGNLVFNRPSKNAKNKVQVRLIVQSVGEGCVWVCDENGSVENGDFLVSSGTRPGFAMRQSDDIARNYTVGRATCDCNFTPGVKEAFIGCVYSM